MYLYIYITEFVYSYLHIFIFVHLEFILSDLSVNKIVFENIFIYK